MTKTKDEVLAEMITLRHQFHQHPELSNQEFATTEKIKQILTEWGISIIPTTLKTGLLAEIQGGKPGAVIALRADLDALPVAEQTDLPFKSQHKGIMHACGHDLHFSSLLGAAYLLHAEKEHLKGTVRLLFQPAEEAGHGGDQVLEKHVLDGVQGIVGFHNNPNLPVGQVAVQAGPLMAGCYKFEVTIHGSGSHGARPEKGKDPIVAQAAIITQLQTIVSRSIRPLDAVVVSVTKVQAGQTWNVLPATATFEGTVRTFTTESTALVKKRFYEIVKRVAAAFEQTVDIDWSVGAYPIHNDPELTAAVIHGLRTQVAVPELTMAGEDFATFENEIPGVFAFIGSNGAVGAADWHEPGYVGKDGTIAAGIDYFIESAHSLLEYFETKQGEQHVRN
ncbi:amidohydrolase [Liquorilactobacillus satsumensis]|uniref:amidohydrolase n=1 Tax=Liquorilactobacillus satsumensis TaxID=259059 RepID=UPI0021C302B5|nr:amidohydrolase [Liquorilactobacillus satsumensis]MCP9312002.1 amidohydrolase [Liquorilactobacillus satsumensis]MCP9358381.1 amidohydrolase [Liquorilactobacillus satsumensis]MCP9359136.1 amidohydrolase [Liquorilactobacillus satsumensis]MCP9372314.1 amidohydrolase [Liquorilactobacillus satsumensis]